MKFGNIHPAIALHCAKVVTREHGLIQPENGWTLTSIDDLGGLDGICEKTGCGTEIRYEHTIYDPKVGYITVGSTCVDYLTQEGQFLSHTVLKIYKKITDFLDNSWWEWRETQFGKSSWSRHTLTTKLEFIHITIIIHFKLL